MNALPRSSTPAYEPPEDLSGLAFHDRKQEELSDDAYFREAWADLCATHENPLGLVHGLALLSFKPDILPTRKIERALALVHANGFEVVEFWTFQHTRHSMRELWRYNWHLYPADRLGMCTLLHSVAPTLVLLLHESRPNPRVPASVRLAAMKGAADPARRHPGQIRTELQPPNAVINHVHVADEPIDVLRELAIFADRPQRREIFARLATNPPPAPGLNEAVERLEAEIPALDLDIDAALSACSREWQWSAQIEREVTSAVHGLRCLTLDQLHGLMPGASSGDLVWYFLLIASYALPIERAISAPTDLLRAGTVEEWDRRNAD